MIVDVFNHLAKISVDIAFINRMTVQLFDVNQNIS